RRRRVRHLQRDRHLPVVAAREVDEELGRERDERSRDLGRDDVLLQELALGHVPADEHEQQRHDDEELLLHWSGPPWARARLSTTSSRRRFFARPSAVEFGAIGRTEPYPVADRRTGFTPWASRNWSTASARAVESSQLERNCAVEMGTESVLPSTRTAFCTPLLDSRLEMRPSSDSERVFRSARPVSNRSSSVSRRITRPRSSIDVRISPEKPCVRA